MGAVDRGLAVCGGVRAEDLLAVERPGCRVEALLAEQLGRCQPERFRTGVVPAAVFLLAALRSSVGLPARRASCAWWGSRRTAIRG